MRLGGGEWGLVPLEGASPVALWDRSRYLFTANPGGSAPLATFDGAAIAEALTRHLCLALAADSIGGARAILEITVAYMKEREQFGKPIASFQALKHRVADHMTDIVSGEEFLSLAVASEASGNPDAGIWARLAKARCTESCLSIAQDCLQLHGGVGFTWEFDCHMYLNRARLSELLVAPNTQLKDEAAASLAESFRAGREPLELA
jgi:alkylation response protein AidB-like acyl-CoA dehydrogenase